MVVFNKIGLSKKRVLVIAGVFLISAVAIGTALFQEYQRKQSLRPNYTPSNSTKLYSQSELEEFDQNFKITDDYTAEDKYYYYLRRANSLSGAGRYAEAVSEYKKVENNGYGLNYSFYFNYAVANELNGDTQEAVRLLNKAKDAANKELSGDQKQRAVQDIDDDIRGLQ